MVNINAPNLGANVWGEFPNSRTYTVGMNIFASVGNAVTEPVLGSA